MEKDGSGQRDGEGDDEELDPDREEEPEDGNDGDTEEGYDDLHYERTTNSAQVGIHQPVAF